VRPYEQKSNISLSGDDVILTSKASLTLVLAVHELATNAAKYGCLSVGDGQLTVSWRVTGAGRPQQLEIDWREAGGPPVIAPSRRGFGTKLIEVSLVRGLGATVDRDFAETGVCCSIAIPLTPDIGSMRADASSSGSST
jgi:two-component sensor histidine kinase